MNPERWINKEDGLEVAILETFDETAGLVRWIVLFRDTDADETIERRICPSLEKAQGHRDRLTRTGMWIDRRFGK